MSRRRPARSITRELMALQRSRSLRDPSTSPYLWLSPYIVGKFGRRPIKVGAMCSNQRTSGVGKQMTICSLDSVSVTKSKLTASKSNYVLRFGNRVEDAEIIKGEESTKKYGSINFSGHTKDPPKDLETHVKMEKMENSGRKASFHGCFGQESPPLEQPEEGSNHTDKECRKYFPVYHERIDIGEMDASSGPNPFSHGPCNGLRMAKNKKCKVASSSHGSVDAKDSGMKNLSAASSSCTQSSIHEKLYVSEDQEENTNMEHSQSSKSKCGIHWNWSNIHHRGKELMESAGRRLSHKLLDSRLHNAESSIQQSFGDTSNIAILSENLSLCADSEELPLLYEPWGSPANTEGPCMATDYSGELRIFTSPNLRYTINLNLHSVATSEGFNFQVGCHDQDQSLIDKYTPRTFTDIVGQNLVVQALLNAISRRKVGLVYLFYGPHGTGKSSCAYSLAKALNCQTITPPKPCDACTHCITYNLIKSIYVLELAPHSKFDFDEIMVSFESERLSSLSPYYRMLIIDNCDALPVDSWGNISKFIDQAPKNLVFVLISCTNVESLPNLIVSRYQKFFFAKLRDSDIIQKLQWIATSEGLEFDRDAMKLIASRSDGSLRNAELILEQLSLLGQRISLPLVQELVGLISDEKLVDLLDKAFTADTVNTIKCLRELIETGVDPLSLLSQLATIITDILAGSFVFNPEKQRPKFWRPSFLKDMEKFRLALKTLFEAEKQLRMSNDKLTCLTAALLQLAPHQHCSRLNSIPQNNSCHSPCILNNNIEKDWPRNSTNSQNAVDSERSICGRLVSENLNKRISNVAPHNDVFKNKDIGGRRGRHKRQTSLGTFLTSARSIEVPEVCDCAKRQRDNEKIWEAVLEKIQPYTIKQFLYKEVKLISVNFGTAPTVHLMLSSHENRSIAEKCRGLILEAFESLLCSPVILEIRCELNEHATETNHPRILNDDKNCRCQITMKRRQLIEDISENGVRSASDHLRRDKDDFVEFYDSANKHELNENAFFQYETATFPQAVSREVAESPLREGSLRTKPESINENLKKENMRLKPTSRSLLWWRTSGIPRRKLLHVRARSRKPNSLMKKLARCGSCLVRNK